MTNEELKKLLAPDENTIHKCEICGQEVQVSWEAIKAHLAPHIEEAVRAEIKEKEQSAEPIESLAGLLESKI